MKDKSRYHVTHGSPAVVTLESESRPIVGEDRERRRFRARVRRAIFLTFALSWAVVVWLIVAAG